MVNVTHYHKHISFPLMLYLIACNDFPYSLSFCLYATDKKKEKRNIILHTQIQVHLFN